MAKSETVEEKQANKDIAAVIYYFYSKYKKTKPDATHYKQNYNLLKALMFPAEEFRTYKADEMKRVIDECIVQGVFMGSLTLLSWPDLCRSIVDKDTQSSKLVLKSIKDMQRKDGIYAEDIETPKGW